MTGDETAAWRVLEQALAAGHRPVDCYLELLVGAIDDITGRSTLPIGPVAEEYLATATAARLVARLGARFRRPGRSRGTVVFGAALGEHHTLAISVVADLVRLGRVSAAWSSGPMCRLRRSPAPRRGLLAWSPWGSGSRLRQTSTPCAKPSTLCTRSTPVSRWSSAARPRPSSLRKG